MIRVLVADERPLLRSGLRHELGKDEAITIVGEASSSEEALALAERLRPEVLLLHEGLPGAPVAEVIAAAHRSSPGTRVVVLCSSGAKKAVLHLLAAGVAGLVLENEPASLLAEAVAAVAQERTWLSPQASGVLTAGAEALDVHQPGPALTERERQVLELLARGESNGSIAIALDVSERTVRFHLKNLYDKLTLGARGELVAYAARALAGDADEAEPAQS